MSGKQGSDSGLAYEYDPDYIGRKCAPRPLHTLLQRPSS